jgi:hypothetical protein
MIEKYPFTGIIDKETPSYRDYRNVRMIEKYPVTGIIEVLGG